MKIILKEDIDNLGFKYDQVQVRPGYANNYLFPQGYAILASPEAIKECNEILRQRSKKEKLLVDQANQTVEQLKNLSIKLFVKVGDSGKLFGSIGAQDLVEELKKQGVQLNKKSISIPGGSVKVSGAHMAKIRLHREVETQVSFEVVPLITKESEKKQGR